VLSAVRAIRLPELRLTAEQQRSLSVAWRAFWISRVLVWVAGAIGVLVFGAVGPNAERADTLSGLLLATVDQWDAGWFVVIATEGYDQSTLDAAAFFPVYPLFVRVVGEPIDALGLAGEYPYQLAGVLVSLAAFIVALYLLHRLTELELGPKAADNAVMLLALFPTSFFFSAIYTESLFLALTVGCLYSARRGWWGRAAALGALAAATRSPGILLLLPLAIMLLYGPRGDREPESAPGRPLLSPRYRVSPREAASLLLVPLGVIAYMGYVRLTTKYGALAPFKAQDIWGREFKGPIIALWDGVGEAYRGVRERLMGIPFFPGDYPHSWHTRNGPLDLLAAVFAVIGLTGALRRLPIAYGGYALGVFIVSISFPPQIAPLYSVPRFILVLFPIFMWAGWAMTHRRHPNLVLAASAVGLGCLSAIFAVGYWVA
jgi:Mannosyltransferase (PIG-V)